MNKLLLTARESPYNPKNSVLEKMHHDIFMSGAKTQLAKIRNSPKLRKEIDKILKLKCKVGTGCPYNYDCEDHPDCFAKELNQIQALFEEA